MWMSECLVLTKYGLCAVRLDVDVLDAKTFKSGDFVAIHKTDIVPLLTVDWNTPLEVHFAW